jgi:hypothetical protein
MAPGLAMDMVPSSTSVRNSPAKPRALRPEPLLEDNPDRFCMFPIKFPAIWEMYKKAEASFWTGEQRHHRRSCSCVGCQSAAPRSSR